MTTHEELLIDHIRYLLGIMDRTNHELNAICISIVYTPEETERIDAAIALILAIESFNIKSAIRPMSAFAVRPSLS